MGDGGDFQATRWGKIPRRHELGGGYDPQRREKLCSYHYGMQARSGTFMGKFRPIGVNSAELETVLCGQP